MAQRFYAGAYNGDLVKFELYVNDSDQISRLYCTNGSDQPASATLIQTTGQIVAQAEFPSGIESYVAIDGSNPFVVDDEQEPIWPFSIRTAWPV